MNLKSLSSSEILSRAKFLCAEERRITLEFLHFLGEIDRRKIYAERGYSSLFLFCTQEFGLSDGSAYRRIESMRLLAEIPEAETPLVSGSLNLTTLSTARGFFKKEKKLKNKLYTAPQKQEILKQLENKSKLECQKIFAELTPEPAVLRQDKERPISKNQIEVTMVISIELQNKLDQIKALLSHKSPNPTWAELLEMMTEQVLKTIDPARKMTLDRTISPTKPTSPEKSKEKYEISETENSRATTPLAKPKPHSRYIPTSIKRQVWKRDQGHCSYQNPKTGRECKSRYFLQIDHRKPFAYGGSSRDPSNLQLLCASHNQLKAVKQGF